MARRATGLVPLAALSVLALGGGAGIAAASTNSVGAATTHGTSAATRTETVRRTNLEDGKNIVVDTRHVTLHVGETTGLQGRQEVAVSWSGAHPTGGIVADQNTPEAANEEYPFVLLECRGVTSSSGPVKDRISPQTCWTQDASERYVQTNDRTIPPWRDDRYATTAQRAQVVNAPRPLPADCSGKPLATAYWLPFIAASGRTFRGGPNGCAGVPPETYASDDAGSAGDALLPSNETFGVTGTDGRGSAEFDVFTAAENASLGCSQTVPCSLVAVPVMGISCDAAGHELPAAKRPSPSEAQASASECEQTGAFKPGQLPQAGDRPDVTVSGSLWWAASNWRGRIVVPLHFGTPADACGVVSKGNAVDVYGSELMIQATDQWSPHFCLNSKLFTLNHVQTGEPEARTLLSSGSVDAAFTSDAPPEGWGRPVVQAPVAVSGFAISYVIDGANGQPYTSLRLDPRLLAKLLTESYPAVLPMQQEDPALAHNPLNITLDPEFIALNPGITRGVDNSEAASALLTLSSDSDVMTALTSYINADPAARAWLNGKPDPWGMVVNPAYTGIALPVDKWPLLSTFEPKAWYSQDLNDCLYNNPVPFLPLVAAPLARLEEIAEAMQFAVGQPTTDCSQVDGTSLGEKLVSQGPQTTGYRFMIGVTSLADADRYGIAKAALQSTPGTYIAPTTTSLRAAAARLNPDQKTGTWALSYDALRKGRQGATAYPGTMLVSVAVPTSGLSAIDAHDYAELLQFAAGPGQTQGTAVGQLPAGYLPMTAANGLGREASFTRAAAMAVVAQKGAVPALSASGSSGIPGTSEAKLTHPAPSASGAGAPAGEPVGGAAVTTGKRVTGAAPLVAPVGAGSIGETLAFAIGGGALAVIVCLALALIGGGGAASAWVIARVKRP